MIIIQLTMGFCQYYTSLLFVSPFLALGEYGKGELNSFMGSFANTNGMASYLCLFYFLLILASNLKGVLNKIAYSIMTIGVIYGVLISGIRTYLLLLMVYFPILLYVKFKNKTLVLGTITVIVFTASTYLVVASYGNTDKAENPIERQINGISALKAGDTDDSTLSYSMFIIENFYNPLHVFGEGRLYTKRGYEKIFLRQYGTPSADVSDAMLVIYLVEFGTIAFFFIIYYYYYMTYRIYVPRGTKLKKDHLIIFSFFLIATITDAGIFNMDVVILLSMLVISLNSPTNIIESERGKLIKLSV